MYLMSLVFGLAAWALGIAAVVRRGCSWLVFSSFTCCVVSLFLEVWAAKCRTEAGDWSALMDTMPAVTFCAGVLLLVTVVLNLTALLRDRKQR